MNQLKNINNESNPFDTNNKNNLEENFELMEREISATEENKLRKALSNNIIFNELTDELL